MSEQSLATVLNSHLSTELPCPFGTPNEAAADTLAVLTHGDHTVAVHLVVDGYLVKFWKSNREQAWGKTSDITALMDGARLWIEGVGLERLATAHPFVHYSGLQLAHERGDAKEYQWRAILDGVHDNLLKELVVLASRNEVLRDLFPHVGHRFALSENENSKDVLVSVFPVRDDWYRIYGHGEDDVEFEGNAAETVDYLVNRLS